MGGRPKGYPAIQAEKSRVIIVEQLEKHFKPIVIKAIKQAKAGDRYAREWLTERGYGKTTNTIAVSGALNIGELLDEAK